MRRGVPNLADVSSQTSKTLAWGMVKIIGLPFCTDLPAGQLGFSASQASIGIAAFDQYEHLADLEKALKAHKNLAAALGGDYIITPDIVIGRKPLSDSEINHGRSILEEGSISTLTPLRKKNYKEGKPLLHASISCKWTIRSDRSQNTRTEALNLIRNRKGKTPHIASVTAEPMPTRLASLAMGTGDIDCVYHMALPELKASVEKSGNEDQEEMLLTLVNRKRLRHISDLTFDLVS